MADKNIPLLDNPLTLFQALESFGKSVDCLSQEGIIEKYPDKWVAAYSGEIRAVADSFEEVLDKLRDGGFPPEHSHIQFMNTKPEVMIL